MTNQDSKMWVEKHLVESGLPYTILQPTHLMDTLPLAMLAKKENIVRPAPWDPATKFSFVSRIDVGEAAAQVFEQRERHIHATYQLVGTEVPLSYDDAVGIVSAELGCEVRQERKAVKEPAAAAVAMTVGDKPPEVQRDVWRGLARMLLHYNEQGLIGNSNVLSMLLGREPLGYRAWVKRTLQTS